MKDDFVSITHGGLKAVPFVWGITDDKKYIVIVNLKGKGRWYLINDVCSVLECLRNEFSQNWFPLGNNVEKLGNGTERKGLGYYLYENHIERRNRVTYAQGASYLGVIFEEIGVFEFNDEPGSTIKWRIRSECDIKKSVIRAEIVEFISSRNNTD